MLVNTTTLFIFFISSILFLGYIVVKYFLNQKSVFQLANEASINSDLDRQPLMLNSVNEAKDMIFLFLEDLKSFLIENTKSALHHILHLFVIILGFISDLTDILYARARDFFLHTATKEKTAVTKFWIHLKEYKKEKEEEKVN